jgi:hypothetical protein
LHRAKAADQRMPSKPDPAVTIQRKYYTDTASRYDHMHAHEGGTDAAITKFMYALVTHAGNPHNSRCWHRNRRRHA